MGKVLVAMVLSFMSVNIFSGTCECLCRTQAFMCGNGTAMTTLENDCTFSSPNQMACESSTCYLPLKLKLRNCTYTR